MFIIMSNKLNMYMLCMYFIHSSQCNGQALKWSYIQDFYKKDTKAGQEATGLRLVPKLKYEYIYLNSFSKMRVDLAAQVGVTLL